VLETKQLPSRNTVFRWFAYSNSRTRSSLAAAQGLIRRRRSDAARSHNFRPAYPFGLKVYRPKGIRLIFYVGGDVEAGSQFGLSRDGCSSREKPCATFDPCTGHLVRGFNALGIRLYDKRNDVSFTPSFERVALTAHHNDH
jgi:hypothetical protein